MKDTRIEFLKTTAAELELLHSNFSSTKPFVVSCEDWLLDNKPAFDFYTVKEIDVAEGRVLALSAGYFSNDRWLIRSGNEVDFWTRSRNTKTQTYQLSYYHPEDCTVENAVASVFLFGYSGDCAIASNQNRNRDRLQNKLLKDKIKQKSLTLLEFNS